MLWKARVHILFLSYSCTVGRIRDTCTDISSRCSLDCGPWGYDYTEGVLGTKNGYFLNLVGTYILRISINCLKLCINEIPCVLMTTWL